MMMKHIKTYKQLYERKTFSLEQSFMPDGEDEKDIYKIVKKLDVKAFQAGGHYHYGFLLKDGHIIFFHTVSGYITISNKPYTQKDFDEDKVLDDFWDDESYDNIMKHEVVNKDSESMRPFYATDVIVDNILNWKRNIKQQDFNL